MRRAQRPNHQQAAGNGGEAAARAKRRRARAPLKAEHALVARTHPVGAHEEHDSLAIWSLGAMFASIDARAQKGTPLAATTAPFLSPALRKLRTQIANERQSDMPYHSTSQKHDGRQSSCACDMAATTESRSFAHSKKHFQPC